MKNKIRTLCISFITLMMLITIMPVIDVQAKELIENSSTNVSSGLKSETKEALDFKKMATTDKMNEYGWMWDASTKTLTIDGLNIVYNGSYADGIISLPFNSTLIVEGNNNITRTNGTLQDSAISVSYFNDDTSMANDGNFCIKGKGLLNISNLNGFMFYAETSNKNNIISISEGVSINAIGVDAGFRVTNGDLVIEDSTVVAKGSNSIAAGIYITEGNLRVKDSTLEASGLHSNGNSGIGIGVIGTDGTGEITIDKSAITTFGQRYGMYAQGSSQIAPNGDKQISIAIFNKSKVTSDGVIKAGDRMSVDNSDVKITTKLKAPADKTPDMHSDDSALQAPCAFWGNKLFIKNNSTFGAFSAYCGVRAAWGMVIQNSTAKIQGDIYGFCSNNKPSDDTTLRLENANVEIFGGVASVYSKTLPIMNENMFIKDGGNIVSTVDNSIYSFSKNSIERKSNEKGLYYLNGASTIVRLSILPADYSKVDEAIANIPSDLSDYKDESVQTLNDAKSAVVRNKNITEQTTVNGYATAIENAIGNLAYKDADYTKVEAAIASIPTNLSIYTAESVQTLKDAEKAVVRDKNITEQTTVNGYAEAIENAIKALEYKDADYTKVNAAIANIPTNLSLYTDTSVKALNAAKQAVVTGLNITKQTTVNGYAEAIENAIKALEYKDADYTKVNAAIANIPTNLSLYTDTSVKALNAAKQAVVTGLNITKQTTVDGYATAIEKAIKDLAYKGADYTKVEEAIASIPTDLSIYTAESVQTLKEAVEAVAAGKNITEQKMVDGYAETIENAIKALKLIMTPTTNTPTIIEGTNQSVSEGENAVFKSNAKFSDFLKVLLDGKELSSDNYTVAEGSTIVTLKADFLKTLSAGSHSLSIVSTTGTATTDFVMKEATSATPETSDNTFKLLYMIFAASSVAVIIFINKKRKGMNIFK